MIEWLRPDFYVSRLIHIPIEYLEAKEIKGVIIDLDNTIAPWDSDVIAEKFAQWLQDVLICNIKIILVSNNKKNRVAAFSQLIGVPYIASAGKPLKKSFIRAKKILDLPSHRMAVIGDQLFTDVFGGNRMGFHTILVQPMANKEFIGTQVLRKFEKFVLKKLALKEG